MNYLQFSFTLNPCVPAYADVLAALLADLGFEAFVDTKDGIDAYIQCRHYCSADLEALLLHFPIPGVDIEFLSRPAEDRDWNETWEAKPFDPIVVDDELTVRDFRSSFPVSTNLEIVLRPRQAFGTGQHPTTHTLLSLLLSLPLEAASVIDAGCGTGVLGILCRMRGARSVLAYDIDPWSVENTRQNVALNGLDGIEVCEGDSSVLEDVPPADLLIANIFREIIIADMPRFAKALTLGGKMLLSGFFVSDAPAVVQAAEAFGLTVDEERDDEGWCALLLRKTKGENKRVATR